MTKDDRNEGAGFFDTSEQRTEGQASFGLIEVGRGRYAGLKSAEVSREKFPDEDLTRQSSPRKVVEYDPDGDMI